MKALLLTFLLLAPFARADEFLDGAKRVVFLGDSITYSGQYVEDFEAWAGMRHPEHPLEVLNLGLPSETVSGLSEAGHAGGKFPRPDLHERLARVLEKTKPDLVFACYGMNDGIYLPLNEERFARFRAGMEKLHAAVEAAGAKIIHLTPPVYDAFAAKKPEAAEYESVLSCYSEWLLQQRAKGWRVIDLHTPMASALAERRKLDPAFTFQKDGVHPNADGHRLMAAALIEGLGGKLEFPETPPFSAFYKLVQQRSHLLRDSWLQACGHLRPGMSPGKPLAEAQEAAAELTAQIAKAVPEVQP